MTELALLIDRRRQIAAQLADLDIEIAIAVGDRDAAQRARHEMEAQVVARRAARAVGCFFLAQGDLDRQVVHGRVAHG